MGLRCELSSLGRDAVGRELPQDLLHLALGVTALPAAGANRASDEPIVLEAPNVVARVPTHPNEVTDAERPCFQLAPPRLRGRRVVAFWRVRYAANSCSRAQKNGSNSSTRET